MTQRQIVIAAILGTLALVATVDHYQYQAHSSRRAAIVTELGGRVGSIMDWPFGQEVVISLPRPLSNEELQRLTLLNARGRDYVSVYFNCEITDEQLQAARHVLSRCAVGAKKND